MPERQPSADEVLAIVRGVAPAEGGRAEQPEREEPMTIKRQPGRKRQPLTGRKMLAAVRLPVAMVKQIDHLAVDWDCYRGAAMERLLNQALELQIAAALRVVSRPDTEDK